MNKNTLYLGTPAARLMMAVAMLGLLEVHSVRAANDTWNGGAAPDGNWTTANNWGGTAPATPDFLFFDGSSQTLTVNNFPAGTPFGSLAFNSSADVFTLSGNALTLTTFTNGIDGTALTPAGGCITNSSGNIETITLPITITAGKHSFATVGGGQLNINGAVTRNLGATVVFNPGNGAINVTGGFNTNGLNNILGGWATIGNDWATLDASSNIVAYTGYTPIATGAIANAPSSNLQYINDIANITAADGTVVNSVMNQEGAARSLTITGTLRLGSNGGIYRNGAATGIFTVTGGKLTANGGGEITLSDGPFTATANNLAVNTLITNDGPNAVSVNILGYVSFAGGTNSYSGGTYINQGRVQITPAGGFGTGPVYVYPGGEILFNGNNTYANNLFIGGVGTTETGGGFGALRIGGTGRTLSGTITLMGDAVIGNSGKITGPITGPGSLFIGHGTANGHGTIQTGGAVANSYSGDTIIGSALSTSDTLQINATFNNIMPHGAGKGNVILNGLSATVTSTFDLNGTTQTINGLTNTTVSPANNAVTNSSLTVGALVLGDNNATMTFAGKVAGPLAVRKIGTGTQSFTGATPYTGDTTVSGGKLVFGTGTSLAASPNITVNTNSTLDLSAISPVTVVAGGSLTASNGTIVVALQGSGNSITTPTLNANGSSNFVTIAAIPSISSYPAQFTAIKYTTLNGALNFGVGGALPVSPSTPYVGYISNNVANGSVDFVVTAGPTSIKWSGYSSGAPNSAWDIGGTPNWVTFAGSPVFYSDGTFANFDDSASNSVVTLNQDVTPAGITVLNSLLTYTYNGGGKITGASGLSKQGSGKLIFDNSGNDDFTGGISIAAGTLQVGNNDTSGNLPAAGNVVDNGALVFARTDTIIDNSTISGTGTVSQNGSGGILTLGGVNTFTGAVNVVQGTLIPGNNSAFGTTNGGTIVSSGATLDVGANAINLGQELVTISGSGVGGNGALVNNSGNTTFVGPNVARVIMAGDATVGGSGRFDFRSANTADSTLASLSTGGHPYKLTKVGPVAFGLIGLNVDPALGNIEVQSGILSMEAATTSLGNTASNLTVWPGATFQMFAITNRLNKVFTLGGDGTATFTVSATSGAGNTIIGPMNITNDCNFNVNNNTVALNLNNVITGPGRIIKVGAGLLTLSGNSPAYTGGIQMNAGSVTVSGTLNNPLGVTASNGKFTLNGILSGAGVVSTAASTVAGSGTNVGTMDILGVLSPGDTNAVGTLTTSNLTLESGATLNYDLASTATPGGGTNDLIVVNGDLTVNGNSIAINPLALLKTGPGNPYRLFNYTGNLVWNADLSVSGPGTYAFVVDTNTPGQVNIVVSGGPPVWNGGSATDSNWSDSANWGGVAVAASSDLFFDGSNRLNNTNDTAADTTYNNIGFNAGAGAFVLNGNPITMGGNINNFSSNPQTVDISLSFGSSFSFIGGAGSPLIIGGGVTNTATATTLTLAGTGILTNLLGSTDPTTMTNQLLMNNSNANWTLVDNASSAAVTLAWQFQLSAGTLNFGSAASAPTFTSTTARGVPGDNSIGALGGAVGMLTVSNGTLTLSSRLNTGTAASATGVVNVVNGTLNILDQFQGANSSATSGSSVNVSGGTFNIGGTNAATSASQFYVASRGPSSLTMSGSGVLNCGILDVSRAINASIPGTVNLNGGTISCSRVGTATANSVAANTGDTATFNFNGGVLKAEASSTTFYQGSVASPAVPITSIVKSGGAIIDTTNFNITFLEPLQHDATLGSTLDGGLIKMGSGTLTLSTANTYNGATVVSNGTLFIGGSLGVTAVTVATNATLAGTGSVGSNVTVNVGGTISPNVVGTIGTFTVASNLTLQGTTAMDINKSTLTNDVLKAGATITYGGTLAVTNLAGTLTASDTFKLFTAASYTGAFTSITPAIPAPGLAWNTNTLATDGILRFVATVNLNPTNVTAVLNGSTLTLSWPPDHTGWHLQAQTNSISTGLGTNWVTIPNTDLSNSYTNTVDAANGTVFYRMTYP